MFGRRGERRGELDLPISITIDTSDRGDCDHRISVFTSEGQFLTSFSRKGEGQGKFDYLYCCTAVPPFNRFTVPPFQFHCFSSTVSLLYCCSTVVLLFHCCSAVPLLFRCSTVVPLFHCCSAVPLLLFHCCSAVPLLFRYMPEMGRGIKNSVPPLPLPLKFQTTISLHQSKKLYLMMAFV